VEETDPSHVVRERKHIVGAEAPASMPMVPPMGMPMSPHMADQPGEPLQQLDVEPAHLDAGFLPVHSFGVEPGVPQAFTPMESGVLTPMEPAVFAPTMPATPAMPVTPAMQGTPALPGTPLQPRILPAGDGPGEPLATGDHDGCCCCCGDFHDGQENRPFSRDDPTAQTTPDQNTPAGEPQRLTHENLPAGQQTPQGEVTKPVPTDEAPDSNDCCACCGDKHAGLEDTPKDSLTNPGGVTEPGEENESDDDIPAGDDDCAHDDDEKPGKDDDSTQGGKGEDDDCPRDEDEKPGKNDDDTENPNEPTQGVDKDGDDCPHNDDTTPEQPGELPATQPATSGDVPLSPRTLPAPAESSQTTPLSPMESTPRPVAPAPQNAATQPESAYQLQPMRRDQGELLTPKSTTPGQPMQSGVLNQMPLASRVEAPKSTPQVERLNPTASSDKPFYKSSPPENQPRQFNALTPAVPAGSTTNGNSPGGGGQGVPDEEESPTEGSTTNPVPGSRREKPASGGNPAYSSGSPYSGSSPYPGVPGQGTGVPQDGNVGPDPNIKFDEASYNQLIAVIGGMKSGLDDSYKIDVVYLDSELLVQPDGQKWPPAQKLVSRGGLFGGSVKRESDALEKSLSTFHTALEQAKGVFKETNDLAAYDATKFTSEYGGFTSGPGAV
jgi:hypothetical protein